MPNWTQVLEEIQKTNSDLQRQSVAAVDMVRRRYLSDLHSLTGRNVIAYYSGWQTNPNAPGIDVNDEDKGAFMMAIHGMEDKTKGLDLILHTPGGGIAAAESLVDYLRRVFGNDIRAMIPQIAMSAGTMIACTCKSIVMGKHSNLGPIDPQVHGLPAAAVRKEIDRALREIEADKAKLQVWQFILNKYNPTFIGQCEQAVEWAKDFVRSHLETNMFAGDPESSAKADRIVETLSDVDTNKSHSKHIHIDKCEELGLKIERLENNQEFQEAVLTVHHCYMHSFGVTDASKIVENHKGATFIKIAN